MKAFKKVPCKEVQASQYGVDESANAFVQLCQVSYDGTIEPVPGDLLGRPKNAFKAVKTKSGWVRIEPSDWVVQKDNELFVVGDGVFSLLFAPA